MLKEGLFAHVVDHPWTNGQVERMNRTIKDATVKRYQYDDHNQLRRHLADFVDAYNFGRRLKTLKGLTPFEFISKCWTSDPQRCKLNPLQQMPGLNTLAKLLSRKTKALRDGIQLGEAITGDGAAIFRHACWMDLEGILSKRIGPRYVSGRRAQSISTEDNPGEAGNGLGNELQNYIGHSYCPYEESCEKMVLR